MLIIESFKRMFCGIGINIYLCSLSGGGKYITLKPLEAFRVAALSASFFHPIKERLFCSAAGIAPGDACTSGG